MNYITTTPFVKVYNVFLNKITDDMYLELSELDTYRLLESLLMGAIFNFEFPRVDLNDWEELEASDEEIYCGIENDYNEAPAILYSSGQFNSVLTDEEINILATYMVVDWIGQQLASIEITRMKYTGSDFKMTSQANHMAKLIQLKNQYKQEGFHLQRLYCRRKRDENGVYKSTFGKIMQPLSDS